MDEIEQFLNPGWLLAQLMQDLLEDRAVKIRSSTVRLRASFRRRSRLRLNTHSISVFWQAEHGGGRYVHCEVSELLPRGT